MRASVKIIISLVVVLVVLLATFAGVYLIRERQLFSKKASTPAGQATISLSPATASIPVNLSQVVTIYLDPAGLPISGVSARIKFEYSGETPEVVVSNIQTSSVIRNSDDWVCPVKSPNSSNGIVTIDIACLNTATEGYSSNTAVALATFNLTSSDIPVVNPVILTFDPLQSIVTRKSDGQDVLLTPSSTGEYTFVSSSISPAPSAAPSSTPEPTSPTSPSATPTDSPGSGDPNSCGGSCGNNTNCESSLYCFQGYCRAPACPYNIDCVCTGNDLTPTPTRTPVSVTTPDGNLPQTGAMQTTLILGLAALVFITTGSFFYLR